MNSEKVSISRNKMNREISHILESHDFAVDDDDEIIIVARGWKGNEWNSKRQQNMVEKCMESAKGSQIFDPDDSVKKILGSTIIVRRGYRAFGHFKCPHCPKKWSSGHVYKTGR